MNDHPRVSPQEADDVSAKLPPSVASAPVEMLGNEVMLLIGRAANGDTVQIMKDGVAIAAITVAPDLDAKTRAAVEVAAREAREKVWQAHKAELLARPPQNRTWKFNREELYDDALKNRGR